MIYNREPHSTPASIPDHIDINQYSISRPTKAVKVIFTPPDSITLV